MPSFMGVELPYGDPGAMRSFAASLRARATTIDAVAARIASLLPASEFRGRAAETFRGRQAEHRRAAARVRDRLQELAQRIDRRAAALEREQEEARRRILEEQRRRAAAAAAASRGMARRR